MLSTSLRSENCNIVRILRSSFSAEKRLFNSDAWLQAKGMMGCAYIIITIIIRKYNNEER